MDYSENVNYHEGAFPPKLDYERLATAMGAASLSIGRYDGVLEGLNNSELLLAPLRRTEAVISSRMEGTVTTLDEILRFEADEGQEIKQTFRGEVLEVICYTRAMIYARHMIDAGYEINEWLMRTTHQQLLDIGRGANKTPGKFKTEQNYIVDRTGKKILFTPISPDHLTQGIERLDLFMSKSDMHPLIQVGLGHVEFEALHPFKDGNGRLGRMMISLYLWQKGVLSAPHFYISEYFDDNKDQYIDLMKRVSSHGEWTDWILFFLDAIKSQAEKNINKSRQITALYEDMKIKFLGTLNSKFSIMALDYIFAKPVFRNAQFVKESGVPEATAQKFATRLAEHGLLTVLDKGAGSRSALYSFPALIQITQP